MSAESALIDRIVHGVLTQLAATGAARTDATQSASQRPVVEVAPATANAATEISDRIITADVLADRLNGATQIVLSPRAIVTPAAWDLIRERGLMVQRGGAKAASSNAPAGAVPASAKSTSVKPLLIVVRNAPAVDRLYDDLKSTWRRELLGCPDDAAKLATTELTRGGAPAVVIVAEQTHRAACLANRNEAVKAVAVRDAADVPVVRKQLRANVWCVDPSGKSWFELRNLLRAIGGK